MQAGCQSTEKNTSRDKQSRSLELFRSSSAVQSFSENSLKIRVVKIPAKDAAQARLVIANRHQYLKDFFTQSIDPYFGTPRWTEECLQRNRIGKVEAHGNQISLTSSLTFDSRFNFGSCGQSARPGLQIYIYCENAASVIEANIVNENPSSRTLDGLRLECAPTPNIRF